MISEPVVTLKLSEYQDLIRRINEKAVHEISVGSRYDIEINGNSQVYYCQSFAINKFHLISDYGQGKNHLTIQHKPSNQ